MTSSHTERPPDGVDAFLDEVHLAIFRHPVAAQAVFSSLIAQGRAWARTPEGAEMAARMANSELVDRSRALWEAASLGVLNDEDAVLPESLMDALVQLIAREGLEPLIARWFERRAERD